MEKQLDITLNGPSMRLQDNENQGVIAIGHSAGDVAPVKLLQASAAACSLGTFRTILDNSKIDYQDISIHSEMTMAQERPHPVQKIVMTITVTGAKADSEKLQRILQMTTKACTVVQSIKQAIDITEQLEIKA